MRSIRQGLITKERSRQAIREMISSGWRCDIETYNRVMDVIEKLDDSMPDERTLDSSL